LYNNVIHHILHTLQIFFISCFLYFLFPEVDVGSSLILTLSKEVLTIISILIIYIYL